MHVKLDHHCAQHDGCIVLQILEALDYMHTRCQIIHTDLKPENVMLTEAIRPRRAALVAAARAGDLTEACLPPASAPGTASEQ